jgi:putative endonuclease
MKASSRNGRDLRGATAYHAGMAAEDQVSQLYDRSGRKVIHRRWRGSTGEIDLIAREGDRIVFIEVKKSSSHALAAEHLTYGQIQRILATASEFVGGEPNGQNTEMRFDVALVDAMGRIEIIENALAA